MLHEEIGECGRGIAGVISAYARQTKDARRSIGSLAEVLMDRGGGKGEGGKGKGKDSQPLELKVLSGRMAASGTEIESSSGFWIPVCKARQDDV